LQSIGDVTINNFAATERVLAAITCKEKTMRKTILAFVFFALCPLLIAQQTLTNDSVIKLVKSGMSEDLIVTTVSGSAGSYDTSAAGLAALKGAGASDKVIAAIQAKAPAAAKATIYIYRPKRMKGMVNYWILFSNGDLLGTMKNNTYIKTQVPAGNWELSEQLHSYDMSIEAEADLRKNSKEIYSTTVEAGKTYYLRLDIGWGIKFTPVDQATAEKEMSKCHLPDDAVTKD
jgi:hypothetical protein